MSDQHTDFESGDHDDGAPYPARSGGPDLRAYTWIVHALYAAALVNGLTAIAGLIIAYTKRPEAAGTIYRSHIDYAIRTFWIGLALMVTGFILSFILIGLVVFALAVVWWLIRVIRPAMALAEGRAIPNPTGFI